MYNSISDIIKDLEKNPAENYGNIYHPIPFNEFENLKTSTNKEGFYKKWNIIKNAITSELGEELSKVNVLDIGANGGFFTFSLANEVASVVAFEPHLRYGVIGKELVKLKGINNVTWFNKPFDLTEVEDKKFDLTLMLSVFQWMAEGGNELEKASKQLMEISKISKYLIFELGFNSGKSSLTTDNPDHYKELLTLLKTNTVYKNFELLGESNFWGSELSRYIVLCS